MCSSLVGALNVGMVEGCAFSATFRPCIVSAIIISMLLPISQPGYFETLRPPARYKYHLLSLSY